LKTWKHFCTSIISFLKLCANWIIVSLGIINWRAPNLFYRLEFTRLTMARTWRKPHLPSYNILYGWPWDQHPNDILTRESQVGVPKFPNLGLSRLWGPITFSTNLRLKWGLKKSCSPRWELSNGMWHVTWTQGNQGKSWLLVVRSQIANLTLGLSFSHNLCLKCPNGLCEPILNIYILKNFQWYKKRLNPMGFDPCNRSLKIRESIRTLVPKVGVPLGVWGFIPSHSFALPGFLSWPSPLQALALVTSPRLGLRHK
jgi:hypothetical protein